MIPYMYLDAVVEGDDIMFVGIFSSYIINYINFNYFPF